MNMENINNSINKVVSNNTVLWRKPKTDSNRMIKGGVTTKIGEYTDKRISLRILEPHRELVLIPLLAEFATDNISVEKFDESDYFEGIGFNVTRRGDYYDIHLVDWLEYQVEKFEVKIVTDEIPIDLSYYEVVLSSDHDDNLAGIYQDSLFLPDLPYLRYNGYVYVSVVGGDLHDINKLLVYDEGSRVMVKDEGIIESLNNDKTRLGLDYNDVVFYYAQ